MVEACSSKSSPRATLLIAAGSSLAFGFGAMNLLSAFSPNTPSLRGMYSYWSATVGDALALPALLGSLAAVSRSMELSRWRIPCAAAAAGIAAAIQASWLADPSPQLNWTLPRPHTFAFAGWYHAGFMIAYSSALGWLVGGIAPRLKGYPLQPRDRVYLTTAATSGFAFLLFALLDNVATAHTRASKATLLGLSVGACAGALAAVHALRRH